MRLGKYQISDLLGKGGFGSVYRAFDTVLEVERAVKVLHPSLSADAEFIARFTREARLAARLDHPGIVPVYDLDEFEGTFYLAMKFMPGGSLKDLILHQGRLPFSQTVAVLRQVTAGLEYAHRQSIIHRDVKPANILLEADGAARLGDFGFARAFEGANSSSISSTGAMVGSPAYMAPEIWHNKPLSSATDVYSLGCVAYEMLSGEMLFKGNSPAEIMMRHVLEGPRFSQEALDAFRPGLGDLLSRALANSPEERISSAAEFAARLENLDLRPPVIFESQPSQPHALPPAQAEPAKPIPVAPPPPVRPDPARPEPGVAPESAAQRPNPPSGKRPWVLLAGVLLAIVLGGFLLEALTNQPLAPTATLAPTAAASPTPLPALPAVATVTAAPTAAPSATPFPTLAPSATAIPPIVFDSFKVIRDTGGELIFSVRYQYTGRKGDFVFGIGCLVEGRDVPCVETGTGNWLKDFGPGSGTLEFKMGLYGPEKYKTDQVYVGMWTWSSTASDRIAYQVFDYAKQWTIVLPTPTMAPAAP